LGNKKGGQSAALALGHYVRAAALARAPRSEGKFISAPVRQAGHLPARRDERDIRRVGHRKVGVEQFRHSGLLAVCRVTQAVDECKGICVTLLASLPEAPALT
jgi:hypothetical protein